MTSTLGTALGHSGGSGVGFGCEIYAARDWRRVMDFIERLFGVSPDGGDGSLELLYIVAIVIVVGTFLFLRRKQLYHRR